MPKAYPVTSRVTRSITGHSGCSCSDLTIDGVEHGIDLEFQGINKAITLTSCEPHK